MNVAAAVGATRDGGIDWQAAGDETVALLRALLRFDTTNPPGNELPCARHVADWLRDAGLEPVVLESQPGRGNVVTRVKGSGALPPLVLVAHLDVVPADRGRWTRDPFGGEVHDGWIWGRGAVDMKHMAAMSMVVLKLLRARGAALVRDVIFAAVSDEEAGCDRGSRFLVDEHPDLVRAEYMLGEVGGATTHIGGKRFYPVMVAEKGICHVRMKVRGEPGHGSMPREDSAVVRLAEAIVQVGRTRLPQHNTRVVEEFLGRLSEALAGVQGVVLERLLNARLAPVILKNVLGRKDPALARSFAAMLSNTASPTVLQGSNKFNVIPGEASVELDGRTLPGQTADDLLAELRALVAHDVEFEVLRDAPPVITEAAGPVVDAITQAVQRHDPGGIVLPTLMPGFTDAKSLSRLGTRCYGFVPVRWPERGPKFSALFHGDDERIPEDGLRWGVKVLHDVVSTLCAR
jgi:acetylornithine deacetylase/succinyl-diaminopimelate desuccinylase-like protein